MKRIARLIYSLYSIFSSATSNLGRVGGITDRITFSQVTQAAAYSAGNCVGGKITLANATRNSVLTGMLQSIFVMDKDNVNSAIEILIFDSDPSSSTITDKSAFILHANDRSKVIKRISIASTDYVSIGGVGIANLEIGCVIKSSGSNAMYAAIVLPSGSSPTYTSTNSLIGAFGIFQD